MLHNDLPEAMRPHMRRVALSVPVPMGDKVITEVWLRQPTGRYMSEYAALVAEDAPESDAAAGVISLATGLSMDQVMEMDLNDIAAVSESIADFFEQAASSSKASENGGPSLPTAPPS